jgi:hypothetical protein
MRTMANMADLMAGVKAKLNRADRHIRELEEEISAFGFEVSRTLPYPGLCTPRLTWPMVARHAGGQGNEDCREVPGVWSLVRDR